MKLQKLCYVTIIALMACLVQTVSAQDSHWSGLGGDGLWGNPNNWTPVGVPPSGAGLTAETGNVFLDAANGSSSMTISNGEVESPGVHTEYPAVHGPWNTLYGPEFGVTLNMHGALSYDWVMAPVQFDPTPGNRSVINMYNGSLLKCDGGAALALGDEWWWLGGPYVTLNMYGNSLAVMTNGSGLWLGGHMNIYDTARFSMSAGGYVNMDNGGILSDLARSITIGGGTLSLPTGWTNSGTAGENPGTVYDWIGRGILRPYGKALDTNDLVITDDGTHTLVTSVALGGSLQRVYFAPLALGSLPVGAFQRAALLGDYPSVSGVLVSSQEPGVNPTTLPGSVVFTSSNPGVATVDSNGIVRAMAQGSATLSATLGTFTSTNTVTVTVTPVSATLVHRYSFNESSGTTASDSVGGANGTLMGPAVFNGSGQVVLSGATNNVILADGVASYVSLPAGLVSNMTQMTVEAWANVNASTSNNWECLYSFGFSDTDPLSGTYGLGGNYITFTPHTGGATAQATFGGGLPGNTGGAIVGCEQDAVIGNPLDGEGNLQITAVYSPYSGAMAVYTNGIQVASIGMFNPLSDPMASQLGYANMSTLKTVLGADPVNYLGASLYGTDPGFNGSIDEFRIYNGRLTASQIAADTALGPNQLRGTSLAPVSLSVTQSGSNLVIKWPTASALVTLQASPALGAGASWTAVAMPSGALTTSGGNYQLTLPISGTVQFYRLSL